MDYKSSTIRLMNQSWDYQDVTMVFVVVSSRDTQRTLWLLELWLRHLLQLCVLPFPLSVEAEGRRVQWCNVM